MSDHSKSNHCVGGCVNLTLGLGITSFIIWLTLLKAHPSFSIKYFYLPALNASDPNVARSNHTLYFKVILENGVKKMGVIYDDVLLSFYYGPNTSFPIANFKLPGFHQGQGKTAVKSGEVATHGVPWDAALNAVSNGSKTAVFRVDLATKVRYKIVFFKTRRRRFTVTNTTVKVNSSGMNSATRQLCSFLTASVFSFNLFVLILLL